MNVHMLTHGTARCKVSLTLLAWVPADHSTSYSRILIQNTTVILWHILSINLQLEIIHLQVNMHITGQFLPARPKG